MVLVSEKLLLRPPKEVNGRCVPHMSPVWRLGCEYANMISVQLIASNKFMNDAELTLIWMLAHKLYENLVAERTW